MSVIKVVTLETQLKSQNLTSKRLHRWRRRFCFMLHDDEKQSTGRDVYLESVQCRLSGRIRRITRISLS